MRLSFILRSNILENLILYFISLFYCSFRFWKRIKKIESIFFEKSIIIFKY